MSFICLKFVKSFAATYISQSLLIKVLLNQIIPEKKSGIEDTELLAGGNYSIWNFQERVKQKRSKYSRGDQQKIIQSFHESSFLALRFSGGITHFYENALACSFVFSRISKTNLETSVGYLRRHVLNHPDSVCSEADR